LEPCQQRNSQDCELFIINILGLRHPYSNVLIIIIRECVKRNYFIYNQ
jgi:hypothetical protein